MAVIAVLMSGCNNNKAHNSLDSDSLAQYRDTLIGKFNGIDVDTLICEPIDSLSPKEDGTYGGCHYEWRVYTKNGTVKDLIVGKVHFSRFFSVSSFIALSTLNEFTDL